MNLMLFTQDESAGVHGHHPQLTVHPTYVSYWCLNEECNQVVCEDLIHITDDNTHNKHAVNAFIEESIQHLKSKWIPIMEIIDFTDNYSSQYKSKFTFHNIMKFGVPYTWHYYGVKHCKGPSDTSGDALKSLCVMQLRQSTVSQ